MGNLTISRLRDLEICIFIVILGCSSFPGIYSSEVSDTGNDNLEDAFSGLPVASDVPSSRTSEEETSSTSNSSNNQMELFPTILRGHEAEPHKYKFMVSLQERQNKHHFCGGSLLSTRQHVLTAAHCMFSKGSSASGSFFPRTASEILAGVGLHNKSAGTDLNYISVRKIEIHKNYNFLANDLANDIAILELSNPVPDTLGSRVSPILLPDSEKINPTPGSRLIAIGWGQLENYRLDRRGNHLSNYKVPDMLQAVYLTVLSMNQCKERLKNNDIPNTKICIDSSAQAVCLGDSGGPIFRQLTSGNFHLDGVTSYVMNNCQQEGSVNVFTRISQFLPWIEQTISERQMFLL